MTPKHFTTLAFTAVASLVVAALVHSRADSWSTGTPAGAKLVANLQRELPKVATITLKQGGQSLTLERKGEAWSLKDRGGFPVQGDRVRQLLLRLTDAELVDRKTRNPERYPLLELEDLTVAGAKSRGLVLAEEKGRAIADLIVGKRSVEQFGAGKGGTYIRRPGERDTWLVSTEIDVNPSVAAWIDTALFEAEIAKVKSVTVTLPGEAPLVVERGEGKPANKDGYGIAGGMPAGKKLKSEYTLEDLVNAFARVEMEDVRRPVAPAAAAAQPAVAVYEMDNGGKITVRVTTEGDARWAVIEATGEGDAKAAIDKINARVTGWQFRLPGWKYDQIFKRVADLVDDAAAPAKQ